MNLRTPQRPRMGHGPLRGLECDEPERGRGNRISASGVAAERSGPPSGGAIVRLAAQPFPGEEGPVGVEQRGVCGRVAPVDSECTLRLHARRRADALRLTYSPVRGNCILEADPPVAQTISDELGAANGVVCGPDALHILARGVC